MITLMILGGPPTEPDPSSATTQDEHSVPGVRMSFRGVIPGHAEGVSPESISTDRGLWIPDSRAALAIRNDGGRLNPRPVFFPVLSGLLPLDETLGSSMPKPAEAGFIADHCFS